ncbi:MAG: hypothetical protein JO131_03365 [Gammaproteobacteria bacterium]|nr:hypothetical protein [Gammaproteobacteria bacterium]
MLRLKVAASPLELVLSMISIVCYAFFEVELDLDLGLFGVIISPHVLFHVNNVADENIIATKPYVFFAD